MESEHAKTQETVPECCTVAHVAEGKAKGRELKLGELDCYISEPEGTKPKACIVIATDIFGFQFINTRLAADRFAEAGFLCVVPNIMGPHAVDPKEINFKPFDEVEKMWWPGRIYQKLLKVKLLPMVIHLYTSLPLAKTIEELHTVLAAIREQFGIEKIGMSGYCWGAKHTLMIASDPKQIQAAVAVHPVSNCSTARH